MKVLLVLLLLICSTWSLPTGSPTDVNETEPITSSDNVVPVTKEETAAIVAAVQEKMDDVVPEESEEEAEDPVADQEGSNPPPIQQSIVRLLPTVEMMVENEIWQYRYPPFDNIFTPQPEEHQQQQQTEKAKLQADFLPSYVIGVLDPSELVDGLFSSSAAVQHQRTPTTILNSPKDEHHQQDETISSNFRLRDSVASSSNSKSDNLPRSFLIFDNERWIWPGNNKKSSS